MSDWFNNHEDWMEQLKAFLGEHLDLTELDELEEDDLMFVSNLAAKLRRGDISVRTAIDEVHKWVQHKMGFHVHHDEERFNLEVAYGDFIEITTQIKENLGVVDQPGIADAIVRCYASPALEIDSDGQITGGKPGDPALAMHCKGWFDINRLSPTEAKDLYWAAVTSLRQHAETN